MSQAYTKADLETMRGWNFARKVNVTQTRIIEWLGRYDWNAYVSFSGGKDSTVLADMVARVYQVFQCPKRNEPLHLVFIDTGLEYPEIRQFVKDYAEWLRETYKIAVDLQMLRPKKSFAKVITENGYPVISKEVAKTVHYAQLGSGWAINRLDGLDTKGKPTEFKKRYIKYRFLKDAPFQVSSYCCDVMKKAPAKEYEHETGRKPFIATMTEESEQRQAAWLAHGCNAFDGKRPTSQPLSFWTEQDVLRYLKEFEIPYASVYGEIVEADPQLTLLEEPEPKKLVTTGCERTGCMFCLFGIMGDKEPNRFQRMRETHPRLYEYCINGGHYEDGKLKPDKDGLGIGKILDYIGKPY